MSIALLFWLLYILSILFGVFVQWPRDGNFRPLGGILLLYVLIGLLGWEAFGAAVHK